MAMGPGKYNDFCDIIKDQTQADGVIVLVIGGDRGNGFSCQASPIITFGLPVMLREMADQVEQSFPSLKEQIIDDFNKKIEEELATTNQGETNGRNG